jgi:3D-(3,5/4)-trihydroxycyclohexane-1,2-dione acylhydrolase (decyclizing)
MNRVRLLTAAQATILYLQRQFSSMDDEKERLIGGMFGIFGHGNVASISQAIDEYGDQLPFYQPKNEQSMVHAAIGYAKAKNRRSTLACTASIGPGSTNMITGAAAATINRIPVLLFASDIFAHRKPGNVLQQLEHPICGDFSVNDCFRPVSRFFDRISRPEQILTALPEAMRVLTDPAETGAVTISFPQDVEAESYEYPERFFEERLWIIRRPLPSDVDIASALAALKSAKRPLIIAGGGVRYSRAQEILRDFSNEFGIPVAETHAGKGVALDAALCLGGMGVTGTVAAGRIAAQADVVLVVGTRLQDFVTGSRSAFQDPDVRFVAVNVNSRDAHKLAGLPVVGDAKLALEALRDGLRASGFVTSKAFQNSVRAEYSEWRRTYESDIWVRAGQPLNQGTIVKLVNEASGPGDIVVAAAGTPPGEIHKGWENGNGSECFLEFGYSTMGHEIPAALGVRLALPGERQVYVIVGDGTYLMAPTEIVTAAQENAKLTVVLIENSGYQCIRDLQEDSTGIDNLGTEFRARGNDGLRPNGNYIDVDFAANAASMGATTISASTVEELQAALVKARALPGPTVIVVKAEKRGRSIGAGVWWDVASAQVTTSEATRKVTEAFRAGAKTQRFFV